MEGAIIRARRSLRGGRVSRFCGGRTGSHPFNKAAVGIISIQNEVKARRRRFIGDRSWEMGVGGRMVKKCESKRSEGGDRDVNLVESQVPGMARGRLRRSRSPAGAPPLAGRQVASIEGRRSSARPSNKQMIQSKKWGSERWRGGEEEMDEPNPREGVRMIVAGAVLGLHQMTRHPYSR